MLFIFVKIFLSDNESVTGVFMNVQWYTQENNTFKLQLSY